MKAIRIHNYGGPEVLRYEDAPRPRVKDGEVLIRVHAAGVNPLDCKLRAGEFIQHKLPLIPGSDVSGVVAEVGAGVSQFKKGDEVFAMADPTRDGAYADYIAIHATALGLKPKSLHHVRAAVMPVSVLTAWRSLFDLGHLESGQRILIHGGSGGVGHFAVQLAKWKGAYVLATASTENQDLLRKLGANHAIDYTTHKFEDVAHNIDIVLDTIGGETQQRSWLVLRKGGLLISLVQPPSKEEADRLGLHGMMCRVQPDGGQLSRIAKLIDSAKLRPMIDRILPLSEARRAHELSENGHVHGKIVLRVKDIQL
ncbi:MAG TPA: NADP-dependent oxidoreductase [Pyrinomonadaceae bacterium]|nr:NADP-dependent oxidoreductase [Pyrinomonadaceae bacterium]